MSSYFVTAFSNVVMPANDPRVHANPKIVPALIPKNKAVIQKSVNDAIKIKMKMKNKNLIAMSVPLSYVYIITDRPGLSISLVNSHYSPHEWGRFADLDICRPRALPYTYNLG